MPTPPADRRRPGHPGGPTPPEGPRASSPHALFRSLFGADTPSRSVFSALCAMCPDFNAAAFGGTTTTAERALLVAAFADVYGRLKTSSCTPVGTFEPLNASVHEALMAMCAEPLAVVTLADHTMDVEVYSLNGMGLLGRYVGVGIFQEGGEALYVMRL